MTFMHGVATMLFWLTAACFALAIIGAAIVTLYAVLCLVIRAWRAITRLDGRRR